MNDEVEEFDDIDTPTDEALLFGDPVEGEEAEGAESDNKTDGLEAKDEATDEAEVKVEQKEESHEEKTRSAQIPRSRFDEVNLKYKAEQAERELLQARIAELEAKPAAVSADVTALEREYLAAVMDGEEDKAVEIRGKINAEIRKDMEASFERTLSAKEQAKAEREQLSMFDATVADMVTTYPVLDSETGNKEAIAEVVEWRDFYISKGEAPHIALQKAANKIAPAYMDQPAAAAVDTRKAEAMQRNAATARTQPPRPDGVGNRTHNTIEIPESQDEWETMPDKDRKSLLN